MAAHRAAYPEQAIAVVGPVDGPEQLVFLLAAIAGDRQPALVAADEPAPQRHHRVRLVAEAVHRHPEGARRHHMGPVDHHRQDPALGLFRRAVQRADRRGVGRIGTDQPELRSEALDEGRLQRRVGAVVEAQHLVAQLLDALLIGARQRRQGPGRLALHVVEVDDDRKVQPRPHSGVLCRDPRRSDQSAVTWQLPPRVRGYPSPNPPATLEIGAGFLPVAIDGR